jgi:hypothetical protein
MNVQKIPSPWGGFLDEVDSVLIESIELHCIGGFVVCMQYGFPRPTNDIDYFSTEPAKKLKSLQEVAGPESELARKFGLHFQFVGVSTLPENYDTRMTEMFPGAFKRLRLFALDAYDLALSKLERNAQRDRQDVEYLAKTVPLDANVLRKRYEYELRPYLANESRHDLTLKLWIEAYFKTPDSADCNH